MNRGDNSDDDPWISINRYNILEKEVIELRKELKAANERIEELNEKLGRMNKVNSKNWEAY